jgi:hypothetical protein
MNTKLPWIFIAVLGVLLVASRAQTPGSAVGAVPRFQLFDGENKAGGTVVFRIDTQTGEVSGYQEGSLAPNESPTQRTLRYAYWQKVDEKWVLHDRIEEIRQAATLP